MFKSTSIEQLLFFRRGCCTHRSVQFFSPFFRLFISLPSSRMIWASHRFEWSPSLSYFSRSLNFSASLLKGFNYWRQAETRFQWYNRVYQSSWLFFLVGALCMRKKWNFNSRNGCIWREMAFRTMKKNKIFSTIKISRKQSG